MNISKLIKPLIVLAFTLVYGCKQHTSKCFCNNGLKYQVIVTLTSSANNKVFGTVSSTEYESDTSVLAHFEGTRSGDSITVRFNDEAPIVGAASEWTNKPWIIKSNKGEESLFIVFSGKDYEMNKWSNYESEFLPCQQQDTASTER